MLRALVTNDDGLDSGGLHALAEAAVANGLEVTVAAPCWDSSGASAALTAVSESGRVMVETGHIPSGSAVYGPALPALGVHGAPAFIVRAAVFGAFGPPPDVVLSGVNRGRNTGRAVLHSGTVGAALTAATHGRSGLAISADVGDPPRWDTAADVARRAIRWLMAAPPASVLNVNVPDLPHDELRGVVDTRLAPAGAVQANVTEIDGGFVAVTFDSHEIGPPGSDVAALSDGYVSVTALHPPREAADVDLAIVIT